MPSNRRKLPKTASIAVPAQNGKLHAPSAMRNAGAIVDAIRQFLPHSGKALEIASGTGEHILRHAGAFPNIIWQPTDIDDERLISIAAWRDESALTNIQPPKFLDAAVGNWASDWAGQDVIILSNLLHLISMPEAENVITQSAAALADGGVLLIYGPFLRGTEFASENDKSFDANLRNSDSAIGYKSFGTVQDIQTLAGLTPVAPKDMPANNLLLAAHKTV